jgi:hypothetical protein
VESRSYSRLHRTAGFAILTVRLKVKAALGPTMITMYGGSGASDYGLAEESPRADDSWGAARARAIRLLRARGATTAADLLERAVTGLYDATNHFNDEFQVLILTLPMAEYLPIADDEKSWRPVFRDIANTPYGKPRKRHQISRSSRLISLIRAWTEDGCLSSARPRGTTASRRSVTPNAFGLSA